MNQFFCIGVNRVTTEMLDCLSAKVRLRRAALQVQDSNRRFGQRAQSSLIPLRGQPSSSPPWNFRSERHVGDTLPMVGESLRDKK